MKIGMLIFMLVLGLNFLTIDTWGSYGLTYRTFWYRDYGTIYRFRVGSWYIGNELPLTFTVKIAIRISI